MNNKTETPEEILGKKCGMTFDEDTYRIQTKLEYIISAMIEFSAQQNKELQNDYDYLNQENYRNISKITELSSELSQQKELVEQKAKEYVEHYNKALLEWESSLESLKQEIEGLKKENETVLQMFNNRTELLLKQSLRIKELEEGANSLVLAIKNIQLPMSHPNLVEILKAHDTVTELLSAPTTESEERKEEKFCDCPENQFAGKSFSVCEKCHKEIVDPF